MSEIRKECAIFEHILINIPSEEIQNELSSVMKSRNRELISEDEYLSVIATDIYSKALPILNKDINEAARIAGKTGNSENSWNIILDYVYQMQLKGYKTEFIYESLEFKKGSGGIMEDILYP
jgi:hypothetical protein